MVDISTVATVLVAVVPSFSAICAIVGGIIVMGGKIKSALKKCEDDSASKIKETTSKLNKAYEDIAIMKSKIVSLEKHLLEEKNKRR